MKKQTTSSVSVQTFILVILAILIAYQVVLTIKVFDFPAIRLGQAASAAPAFKDPGDLSAYRWLETAKGYERLGLLNPRMSPSELEAYRWQAIAQGYADNGMLNYHDNADDLLAYRWIETAKGYERLGLLAYHDNADDLMAYRWQAMAEAYEKMGLLNTP